MQSLPSDVLQEIQREGEGQTQQTGGGAGAAQQRRRRMGKDALSEARETALPLATPNRTPASPPAAPFLSSGRSSSPTWSHRRSRTETPSPSGRRTGVFGGEAEASRERPYGGSGEVRKAWRTPSPEEVPSELLGPGVEASIDPDTRPPEQQFSTFSFLLKTPGGREMGAMPASNALQRVDSGHTEQQPLMKFNIPTFSDRSPGIEDQDSDSPAASQASSNSSYAHRLYHRSDTLVRKIKPQQHRDKIQCSTGRSTPPLRSPTYGMPKVVGDSGDPLSALYTTHGSGAEQAFQAFTSANSKAPIGPLRLPPKALKKIASSASSEQASTHKSSDGSSPSKAALQKLAEVKRPGNLRSSASLDVAALPSGQHIHIAELPSPLAAGRDAQAIRIKIAARKKQEHSSSSQTTPTSPMAWAGVIETGGSPDSGSTPSRPFQSDESYFTSLRAKIAGRQGFTPTLMPSHEAESPAPMEHPFSTSPTASPPSKAHEPVQATSEKPKRGSIFGVLGRSLLAKRDTSESTEAKQTNPPPDPMPPLRPMGDNSTAMPVAENVHLPPHFAVPRPRDSKQSPHGLGSPLSAISPTSTNTAATDTAVGFPSNVVAADIPISPYTPLPPLRDNYDRSRRVSIELPGSHVPHRPSDTPFHSPNATPNSQPATPQASSEPAAEAVQASSRSRRGRRSLRLLGLKRRLPTITSIHLKRRYKADTKDAMPEPIANNKPRRPSVGAALPLKLPRKQQTPFPSPATGGSEAEPPTPTSMRSSKSSGPTTSDHNQEAPIRTS